MPKQKAKGAMTRDALKERIQEAIHTQSFDALLRRPPDDEIEMPPPPPPPISMPAVVLKLRLPNILPQGLNTDQQDAVRNALLEQGRLNGYPDTSVHIKVSQSVTEIGVWYSDPSPFETSRAKQAGFSSAAINTPFFEESNSWAMSVNQGTIDREFRKRWNDGTIPHDYDDDFTPCFRNEYDIHLYNMFPYFIESGNVLNPRRDRVYTITGGKYNLSAPDINFTATTEDVFKIGEDGKLFISESHSEVDADTTPLHILTGLFLLIGAVYTAVSGIGLGIAPFLAGAVFGVQDIAANVSDPDMPAGVGKFIADKFFPKDITLPGLPSFPLRYKKFVVGPALLKAAGSMD